MARYVYGTSAYKYEEQQKPEIRKKRKRKVKIDIVSVLGFALVVALAFTLLARYALITEKTAKIESLKKDYEKVNSIIVKSEYELEKNIDLKKIEEIAVTKLGMQRPEKHQLVYISMKNSDYCEVKEENKKGGFLAKISSGIFNTAE